MIFYFATLCAAMYRRNVPPQCTAARNRIPSVIILILIILSDIDSIRPPSCYNVVRFDMESTNYKKVCRENIILIYYRPYRPSKILSTNYKKVCRENIILKVSLRLFDMRDNFQTVLVRKFSSNCLMSIGIIELDRTGQFFSS